MLTQQQTDERYMARALQLARNGEGFAAPNPMVGAVIVAPDGRVIGEGWHRRCGEPHAEVRAVASVAEADRPLLSQSTIYVTLEPCSHYGKTPPCANLLIECGFPRVVVATSDPFPQVAGRGIAMLRQAGAKVDVGILREEARALNRKFFTAHTLKRPFITLKWAQSLDGFMDARPVGTDPSQPAFRFSTPLSRTEVMRLRATHDAILTSAATVRADRARFTIRGFDGRAPRVFILDASRRLVDAATGKVADISTPAERTEIIEDYRHDCLDEVLRRLYADRGVTSLLVEAGPTLLSALLTAGLWDEIHRETAPLTLGLHGSAPAPSIPPCRLADTFSLGNRRIDIFQPLSNTH